MFKLLLLVEDDENLAKVLTRLLRIRLPNIKVLHVTTARAAIALARTFRFDAVLSDYNLADGSHGSEVLDYLKAEQPARVGRFVYLSDDPRCREHRHVLEKPASNMDVVAKLREVMP